MLFCLSLAATANADVAGKVVKVTDGDTTQVLTSEQELFKIRLTGIDAPESKQPFGNASRKNLADMVAGKEVLVESSKTDRYGRVLGKVWVKPSDCASCGKTLDANHAQLLAGMAWWYRYYAKEQPPEDRGRYESAEEGAVKRNLGLWSEPSPVPPWDWRKGARSVTEAPVATEDSTCGSKRYCKEMTSCEEAKFYLKLCGRTSLDGDKDGVPCVAVQVTRL